MSGSVFVFHLVLKASGFLDIFWLLAEYCLSFGESSFCFVLRYFCKRSVFIHLLHLFLALFTFGVLSP